MRTQHLHSFLLRYFTLIAAVPAFFGTGDLEGRETREEPVRTVYALNSLGVLRANPKILVLGSWIDPETGQRVEPDDRARKFLPDGGRWFAWVSLRNPAIPDGLRTGEDAEAVLQFAARAFGPGPQRLRFRIIPFTDQPPEPSLQAMTDGDAGETLEQVVETERRVYQAPLEAVMGEEFLENLRQDDGEARGFVVIFEMPVDDGVEPAGTVQVFPDTVGLGIRETQPERSPLDDDALEGLELAMPDAPLRFTQGATEVPQLPDPRGWADVTDTPFTVDNTGEGEAGEALQLALTHHAGTGNTLFLPNGVYLLRQGIIIPSWGSAAGAIRGTHLVGQSRDGVILRLAPNSRRYQNPGKPAVVLDCEEPTDPARAPLVTIENLTIEVSEGNPGAVALRYSSSPRGYVRNVKIIDRNAEAGGYLGLLLNMPRTSDAALTGVTVEGFRYGVVTANNGAQGFFRGLITSGQQIAGVWNRGSHNTFLQWTSRNAAPALYQKNDGARALILKSRLQGETGAQPEPALNWHAGEVDFYETGIQGYETLFKGGQINDDGSINAPNKRAGGWMTEPGSNVIGRLKLGAPHEPDETMPELELPEPAVTYQGDWVEVEITTGADEPIGEALQAALESGAPNIQAPLGNYVIDRKLVIPPTVRCLYGGWSRLRFSEDLSRLEAPVFLVKAPENGGVAEPLVFEKWNIESARDPGRPVLENPTNRPVLLRDVTSRTAPLYAARREDGGDPGQVIFENVTVEPALRPASLWPIALELVNQQAWFLQSRLPVFLAADSTVTGFATQIDTRESLSPVRSWEYSPTNWQLRQPDTPPDLPALRMTQKVRRLQEGHEMEEAVLELNLRAHTGPAIAESEESRESADPADGPALPEINGEARVRLAFEKMETGEVHHWQQALKPGESIGLRLTELIADDAVFTPPSHWRIRLEDVENYRALLSDVRGLRPIVVEGNDLAPGYGLLRHFEFFQAENPGHDSSNQALDGVAEKVRIPVEQETGLLSFGQETARLRIAATREESARADGSQGQSHAVSLWFTGLAGADGPRGLLYEYGAQGGLMIGVENGRVHASVSPTESQAVATLSADLPGEEGWSHLVVQFHLGFFEIFLDGERVAEQWCDFAWLEEFHSAALGNAEGPVPVRQEQDDNKVDAGNDAVQAFEGLMADVRIYERALNPVEIELLARSRTRGGGQGE